MAFAELGKNGWESEVSWGCRRQQYRTEWEAHLRFIIVFLPLIRHDAESQKEKPYCQEC